MTPRICKRNVFDCRQTESTIATQRYYNRIDSGTASVEQQPWH